MLETDPLTGDLRLVAPGRAARLGAKPRGCPFCVGNEHTTPPETGRIEQDPPDPETGSTWRARSFPNLFPLTQPHEVLVPTPRHATNWRDLTIRELGDGLQLLLERRAQLAADGRYVHAFVNDGAGAGASLPHVHAQLVSIPRGAHSDRLVAGVHDPDTCTLCGLLTDTDLVIERGMHHSLVAHPAPRIGGGMILTANVHDTTPSDEHPAELAALLHRALVAAPDADLNMWLVADEVAGAHWYLEIQPRTANLAGVELALGLGVCAMTPTDCAASARERLAMHAAGSST